jgi:hypothetical protein
LRDDESLWELLDTPLTLNIIRLSFNGVGESPSVLLRAGTVEERRAALFDAYIEAMFRRRETTAPYTPEQTRHWLSWLAQSMVRHEQTVFYLERMQPDWLPKEQARLQKICSGLVAGLVGGLIGGLGGGLGFGLRGALPVGLPVGLFLGLLGVFGLPRGEAIQPLEAFRWSWKARDFLDGVLGSMLVIGPLFGLVGWAAGGLKTALGFWLLGGLFVGLFGTMGEGFTKEKIPARRIPNEGIRRSLSNTLFLGLAVLVVGLSLGLLAELVGGLGLELLGGLGAGLGAGLGLGLVGGLIFGIVQAGYVCIEHGALRVLLWRYDYAPLNYVRFLDHAAAERLFLRKVGGGYIFVHQLLMEHFADLKAPVGSDSGG